MACPCPVARVFPSLLAAAALLAPASAEAHGRGSLGIGLHFGRHAGRRFGHHHHGSSYAVSLGFGLVGAGWGAPVYPFYGPPYPVYLPAYEPLPLHAGRYPGGGAYGRIETDVRPARAAVYIDGTPVGIADDFDGWPAKLHAAPGRHQLLFREPGYVPLRVEVEVLPYHTVRVRDRMERGVDDPGSAGSAPAAAAPPGRQPSRSSPAGTGRGGGRLALEVLPADARVFVDGRRDVEASAGASYLLELEPGSHRVEVVRPGFEPFTGEVVVAPGQRQELQVRLVPREVP